MEGSCACPGTLPQPAGAKEELASSEEEALTERAVPQLNAWEPRGLAGGDGVLGTAIVQDGCCLVTASGCVFATQRDHWRGVYGHRAGDTVGGGPALAEHKVLFAGELWPWLSGLVLWPG